MLPSYFLAIFSVWNLWFCLSPEAKYPMDYIYPEYVWHSGLEIFRRRLPRTCVDEIDNGWGARRKVPMPLLSGAIPISEEQVGVVIEHKKSHLNPMHSLLTATIAMLIVCYSDFQCLMIHPQITTCLPPALCKRGKTNADLQYLWRKQTSRKLQGCLYPKISIIANFTAKHP